MWDLISHNIFVQLALVVFGFLTFAGVQRKWFPHTAVNGLMRKELAQTLCPEVFGEAQESEKKEP